MDLNMIKGLGPAFRQTLYRNGVYHVEQLVKILPAKVIFHEPIDLNTVNQNGVVTVTISILSIDNKESDDFYTVCANCNDIIITTILKKHQVLLKQLIPGTNFRVQGYFDIEKKCLDVYNVYSQKQKIFNIIYEVGDLPTSQVQNFSEKGLCILNDFNNEIPTYIKEKLNIKLYKDILYDIHMPNNAESFTSGLKKYTFEAAFNYFVRYYYYILTTSQIRNEEKFDVDKINTLIKKYDEIATTERKKLLNELLKEFTKPFYTNVIVENQNNEEKELVTLLSIITKVSMKKQVVIITKRKFDDYINLKDTLLEYNIKMDVMARKGRNKESFSNFNTGKFDVLITNPINFDELNKEQIGLVIIDEDTFDLSVRYSFNCSNVDTIFYSNSHFKNNVDKNIYKNLALISFCEESKTEIEIVLKEIFNDLNYDIIKEMLTIDEIKNVINEAAKEALAFVKEKKFKDNKENYRYLKKNIETLFEQNLITKK